MGSPYAILIATRNRPSELEKLLLSISELTFPPKNVIIVSSGVSISPTLTKHQDLNIIHQHIEGYGQIRQKMLGITLIPKGVKWILFLDDDLILEKNSTKIIFSFIDESADRHIIGIGLAEASTNPRAAWNPLARRKFGKVTKSGKNIDYAASTKAITTSWLNGASIWKREYVNHYKFEFLESRYSICEDLIFSYSMSKLGQLIFLPNAKFQFQANVENQFYNEEVFRARAYWKFHFVRMFSDLSISQFLLSQGLSTLSFVLRKQKSRDSFPIRLRMGTQIMIDLLVNSVKDTDSVDLLKKRLN